MPGHIIGVGQFEREFGRNSAVMHMMVMGAEIMRITGEAERLDGRIEMDDAYLGG